MQTPLAVSVAVVAVAAVVVAAAAALFSAVRLVAVAVLVWPVWSCQSVSAGASAEPWRGTST